MIRLRAITALALLLPGVAAAEDFSGRFTGSIVKQEILPFADGGMAMANLSKATNVDAAGNGFMDGAQVTMTGSAILTQGNGPEQGVITLVGKDGVASAAFKGRIATTMESGQPRTASSGTWETFQGSGPYRTYKGGGTYALTMTSPTEFTGEWKGSMTVLELDVADTPRNR